MIDGRTDRIAFCTVTAGQAVKTEEKACIALNDTAMNESIRIFI